MMTPPHMRQIAGKKIRGPILRHSTVVGAWKITYVMKNDNVIKLLLLAC